MTCKVQGALLQFKHSVVEKLLSFVKLVSPVRKPINPAFLVKFVVTLILHIQAHREGGGGGGGGTGDTSPGPTSFEGPHEAFIIFTFMCCIFTLFLYLSLSWHCLDSVHE